MTPWFVLLHKVLPLVVMPLGVAIGLIAWGAVRRRRGPLVGAILVLWLCGSPISGEWGLRALEGAYPRLAADEAPAADAIVVLGGFVSDRPDAGLREWNDAVDRFDAGVALHRAGKAPVVVVSMGREGQDVGGAWVREVAARRGLPAEAAMVPPVAVNTAAEARVVRELRDRNGWRRILLVTSAFHMPRAMLLFEGEGLEVVPFPVDYRATQCNGGKVGCFVPDAEALWRCQIAIRELLGYAFYWLRSR